MHAGQEPFHHAPASFGGLMDPAFVRDVAHDAEGGHRVSTPLWGGLKAWLASLQRSGDRLLNR